MQQQTTTLRIVACKEHKHLVTHPEFINIDRGTCSFVPCGNTGSVEGTIRLPDLRNREWWEANAAIVTILRVVLDEDTGQDWVRKLAVWLAENRDSENLPILDIDLRDA